MNYKKRLQTVVKRKESDLVKIHQLPETLANKIAAGEVVERPASVVKELVENSIDANSTYIKVQLYEAGLQEISVTDNGDGISEEDCKRAFLRHATSKIKYDTDLFHIRSEEHTSELQSRFDL